MKLDLNVWPPESEKPNVSFEDRAWKPLKSQPPRNGQTVIVWDKSAGFPVTAIYFNSTLYHLTYTTVGHRTAGFADFTTPEDIMLGSHPASEIVDAHMDDIHYWRPLMEEPPK